MNIIYEQASRSSRTAGSSSLLCSSSVGTKGCRWPQQQRQQQQQQQQPSNNSSTGNNNGHTGGYNLSIIHQYLINEVRTTRQVNGHNGGYNLTGGTQFKVPARADGGWAIIDFVNRVSSIIINNNQQ